MVTYAQNDKKNELKNHVFNIDSLIKFIEKDFEDYKLNKFEIVQQKHFLSIQNFNKRLKKNYINYQLFDISTDSIFAYKKNETEVAIFILMNINSFEQLLRFSFILGIPENTTNEDFEKGDFDVLMWRYNGLEISIRHSFIEGRTKNSKIIIISNVSHPMDLINTDSWD